MTKLKPKVGDIVRFDRLYGNPSIDYSDILGIIVGIDQQKEPKTWLSKDHVLIHWFHHVSLLALLPESSTIYNPVCRHLRTIRLYEVGL